MDLTAFVVGLVSGLISGVVASLAVVIVLGVVRAPHLNLEIGQTADGTYQHGRFRFVHVRVVNQGWSIWRWQIRRPATMCRASVSFGDLGSTVPRLTLDGRWTSRPEPVHQGAINLGEALTVHREHLVPGDDPIEIAIAIKKEGVTDCFGFNNRSYLYPDWSNPEWALEPDTYWVRVVITAAEARTQRTFHLVNTGTASTGLHLRLGTV
jgi:hypothetical protein